LKPARLVGSSGRRPAPAAKLTLTGVRRGCGLARRCRSWRARRGGSHGAWNVQRPPVRVAILLCGATEDEEELRLLPICANLAESLGQVARVGGEPRPRRRTPGLVPCTTASAPRRWRNAAAGHRIHRADA
jgi:hypothetical protein